MIGGALIVTALLPHDVHNWATALRTRHFPPERNFLEAHVTLFHALPPSAEAEVSRALAAITRNYAPIAGRISGLYSLGRGTAFGLDSHGLLSLRARLADLFHGLLSAQDQQSPRLHITVQNKVSSNEARALQAELSDQPKPPPFTFRGLGLYRYLGGPWDPVKEFSFRGPSFP